MLLIISVSSADPPLTPAATFPTLLNPSPNPEPHPNTPEPQQPVTTPSQSPNFCASKIGGIYAKPDDPGSYYSCANGITWVIPCPPNLVFQESCLCCNYP